MSEHLPFTQSSRKENRCPAPAPTLSWSDHGRMISINIYLLSSDLCIVLCKSPSRAESITGVAHIMQCCGNTITDLNKLHGAAIMTPAPTQAIIDTDMTEPEPRGWRIRREYLWDVSLLLFLFHVSISREIYFVMRQQLFQFGSEILLNFIKYKYINKFCSDCTFYRIYWIYRIEPSKTNGQNEILKCI